MLGQSAQRTVQRLPDTVPADSLIISSTEDLALVLPKEVRAATESAEIYKLFFVFENFLRDFVLDSLSDVEKENWWNRVPKDVQSEVEKHEETEEQKQWMALNSRSKLALTTLPQLIRIIDDSANWSDIFKVIVRDKLLLQEARSISHVRNTICHMSPVSDEEAERVKLVMRDWFRVISP
jgi:Swt1-like HEPN